MKKAPSSERGAVLVHVALALIALMSFSTFVVDYGVLWTARRQAQNAADAAALAGAVALAFDNPNPSGWGPTGAAKLSVNEVLMNHPIWGQHPVVNPGDVIVPECPVGDPTNTCVRVSVYRDAAHGGALPMIFGQLVGLNQQSVRAFAWAKVNSANASNCLKPWAIADKWFEQNGAPDQFNPATQGGFPGPDTYTPQNGTNNAGTGFAFENDDGDPLTLQMGIPATPVTVSVAFGHWYHPLDLCPGGGCASVGYQNTIQGCVGQTWRVGDTIPTLAFNPALPTELGVHNLVNLDDEAFWDPTLNGGRGGVRNSCVYNQTCHDAQGHPTQYSQSPRIVAIPVFNLQIYEASGTVVVVNILGFFIDSVPGSGSKVTGHIMVMPNELIMPDPLETGVTRFVADSASFIRAIGLIR